ncbi:MAG: ribosome small subunit-dependent GTPase A [Negativicutes bacterium]|nr:ribosome small subunit-dependent GTPase A [Negativicutes bacterium]
MPEGVVIGTGSGYYRVQAEGGEQYLCRLPGRVRRQRQSVVIGDRVVFQATSENSGTISQRRLRVSYLPRPEVANADQVVCVTAGEGPVFDHLFLDRLLAVVSLAGLLPLICCNKIDIADRRLVDSSLDLYRQLGYRCLVSSAVTGEGLAELTACMTGKISVLAGQSGVGKTSLLNALAPGRKRAIGELSKIGRGRHTTTASCLLAVGSGWVVDTPGFSRLDLAGYNWPDLAGCFSEIQAAAAGCRFSTCSHSHEPQCAVRNAVGSRIAPARLASFLAIRVEWEKNRQKRGKS